MDKRIEVNLMRIEDCIAKLGRSKFPTMDVIRQCSGQFFSNGETPVVYSFNAWFGNFLKRNGMPFRITELRVTRILKMTMVIQQPHSDGVQAHNTALQSTANPLRGLSAAELGR